MQAYRDIQEQFGCRKLGPGNHEAPRKAVFPRHYRKSFPISPRGAESPDRGNWRPLIPWTVNRIVAESWAREDLNSLLNRRKDGQTAGRLQFHSLPRRVSVSRRFLM